MTARIRSMLLVAVVGLIPAGALAGPIQFGDTLRLLSSDGTLGGGAFHVDDITNGIGEDLLTFCLQLTDPIDYSSLFTVGGITDSADDPGGPDFLSAETRWIFTRFLSGELGGYGSDEIQAAIWKLEGEWTTDVLNSTTLIADAQAAVSGGFTDENVKVVNLFYATGAPAQDLLILTPVPEPATILLFGTGLAAVIRRRRPRVPLKEI